MRRAGRLSRIGRSALALCCLGAVLAACSKNEGGTAPAGGQVVARVGNQVITTQELDTEFRWANVPNDKRKDPDIVKRVLGDLVARKYLLQQALTAKLDREPNVLLDLLRAREQVLASAVVSRDVNTKVAAIRKADIDKYIASNPSKFAERLILTVEQITFPLGPTAQSIVDATKPMGSLDEIDQKLTELGVAHSRSTGFLNGAELPDELSKQIKARKPDDVFFVRAGQNGVFLKIKSEESRPLDGEAAANLARQLMRADLLKAEAAMTTFSANMEAKYEGDYAVIMNPPGEKK